MRGSTSLIALFALLGCRGSGNVASPDAPEPPAEPKSLSVVVTNDLHGHLQALPILGGYIDNLREARGEESVVLIDAGDMFQGTLISNLNRGAAAIAAYNELGYHAAAIGNHEFDFGPEGPAPTPQEPGDDPRGALKARAAEADFPLLAANLAEEGGSRVSWENVPATAMIEVEGVKVGIIGVTTESTPHTTIATNFEGLEVWPLAATVRKQARNLRAEGAAAVVVAAHAGGRCSRFDDPEDLSSCDTSGEVFELARELPAKLVDVIAAGHTHGGIAHRVNGIPVVEAYAKGAAFARVDLEVRPDAGEVQNVEIHPPEVFCENEEGEPRPADECEHTTYAGAEVSPSEDVEAIVADAASVAEEVRSRPLNVEVVERIGRGYASESALGNLFADLMREAVPEADVAITNGGGLRADLPAGELTYGELHRATPFDNQFSLVSLRAEHLAELLGENLGQSSGILLVSGMRAGARCADGELEIELSWEDGSAMPEDEELLVATSDFLAPGGSGGLFGGLDLPAEAVRAGEGEIIRDAMAEILKERGGTLKPADYVDPERPRLAYPGDRPVRCGQE